MFRLTKYGLRELVVSTLLAAVVLWLAVRTGWPLLWVPVTVVVAAVWLWVLWFFRDPQRATPQGPGLFVSPADGTVSDITPIGAGSELGCEGMQVGIFMSVFSVHVNRCPCEGVVESVTHRMGAFLDARDPAASARNESATIVLRVQHGGRSYPVIMRQVAGLIARRIVTDVAKGDSLARGQRVGMIKFGSRCELLVPGELAGAVLVKIGQKVCAGKTVLVSQNKESQ